MTSQDFYGKDGIMFSSNKTSFEIITEDKEIIIDPSISYPKCNELLFQELNSFKKKFSKKVDVSGEIKNFKKIKEDIEKKSKSDFGAPKSDDYLFIEATSQLSVLEGLISSLDNQYFRNVDSSVNSTLREIEDLEKRKVKALEKSIVSHNEKIKKIENDNKLLEKGELKRAKEKISLKEKEIEKYISKKNSLDKRINEKGQSKESLKIEKIERKIAQLEHKFSDYELQISICGTRVKKLKSEHKKGKKKQIEPLIFVATLGLIYWTKFSDTKYKIYRNESKIYRLEEKKLEIKRKIKKLKREISELLSSKKVKNKDVLKKQEELIAEFEKTNVEISNLKKDLKKLENDYEKKAEKIKSSQDRIQNVKSEIEDMKKLEKHYEEISSENIRKFILDLRLHNKETIKQLKEYKKTLESQKVDLRGEFVVQL